MSAPTNEELKALRRHVRYDLTGTERLMVECDAERLEAVLVELLAARRTLAKVRAEVGPVVRLAEKATPDWRVDSDCADRKFSPPREGLAVRSHDGELPCLESWLTAGGKDEARANVRAAVAARNLIPRLARVLDGEE